MHRYAMVLMAALSIPTTFAGARASQSAAALDAAGVPNFHQVNASLYRGGQPTADGWASLAKLGVKTVIDLRRVGEHSTEAEARAVEAAGMRYVNFPMNGFDTPTAESVAPILARFGDDDVVFVHCKLGMDRTGSVVAAYRMAHDGWSSDQALAEALANGLHWYERGMMRFIRGYRTAAATLADARPLPARDASIVSPTVDGVAAGQR